MVNPSPAASIPASAAPATPPVVKDEKPVAAPATPPAGAKPAVTPSPAKPEATTVPLPELLEERNKRQALEKTVLDMQNELLAMKRVAPTPAAPAPQQNDVQRQLDQLWESDPRRAVQAEIMTAMSWYDTVQAQVDTQEHDLAMKYPDYNNYRNEIRGYVRSLPIAERMRNGVVELAYYAVKGQKIDTTMDSMKKQWEEEFIRKYQAGEIGNLPSGAVTTPPVIPHVQATDEEKRVAEAMGMPVEEYLKHRRS